MRSLLRQIVGFGMLGVVTGFFAPYGISWLPINPEATYLFAAVGSAVGAVLSFMPRPIVFCAISMIWGAILVSISGLIIFATLDNRIFILNTEYYQVAFTILGGLAGLLLFRRNRQKVRPHL